MKFFADLHLHSKFSRATSKDLTIPNLDKYARIKGLNLLGTGDFTHPDWLAELKQYLHEDGTGIPKSANGMSYVLQTEISSIYTQGGKGRRVHNIILAPSFEVVDQVNAHLAKKGNLRSDGRPIIGRYPCADMVEDLKKISNDIEIIPAHCLLPSARIHANPKFKPISKLREGDHVLTHEGRFQKVLKVYTRAYDGAVHRVIPWYFREGTTVTPEHPFYAIKSSKNCKWIKGLCKPLCSQGKNCRKKHYLKYAPSWLPAEMLEIGDFLIYPRLREIHDVEEIKLADVLQLKPDGSYVSCGGTRGISIPNNIKIDSLFCRLAGYYVAEGYTNSRDAVCFCFKTDEVEYINDVASLMEQIFGIKISKRVVKGKGIELIYCSKTLYPFFSKLFYNGGGSRAENKCLPDWMLSLPDKKKMEILRGWWRGDSGYTVSQELADQMKTICLSLGIIPSINIDNACNFEKRGNHFIGERKISTNNDTIVFSNLSFFEEMRELLDDKCFKKFHNKRNAKHGWIDEKYVYLPIRRMEKNKYTGTVFNLEVEKDNSYVTEFATVHNCWTPWFSVFGSMSGFDSIDDCFRDQAKHIHALETGLSSDPAMNWRLSQLDRFALISNSDSHSFWPWRIGRECNLFELKELTYKNIINALREKDPKKFLGTVEVNPAYGKYHVDGHRLCNISMEPKETKKHNGLCPVCGKPLVIGVLNRVEELADRPEGYVPKGAIPFYTMLPLSEVIANALGEGTVASKKVWAVFSPLIEKFGNEFSVLMDAPREELEKVVAPKIADIIMKNRIGAIQVKPGYDGVYGVPVIDGAGRVFSGDEANNEIERAQKSGNAKKGPQKSLFEFK